MSYLLAQILVCLLIAGLIGAVIGWLLRGGCSRKLRDCEEEWKLKLGSIENDYNSRLQNQSFYNGDSAQDINVEGDVTEQARLKGYDKGDNTTTPLMSVGGGLENETDFDGNSSYRDIEATKTDIEETKKGRILNQEKLSLYKKHGIDIHTDDHLEDDYDIQTIEGIGPKYASIFNALGIYTTSDLVHRLKGKEDDIQKFAKELRVQPDAIESWISMAELIALPGVNAQHAELLQVVGISSISDLADANPDRLHNEMRSFNEKSPITPNHPSSKWVQIWTKISKALS
ncbi:MAG: hypothetical protein DSZ06_04810 [Sulfurospirillum sp.]|nr:MAG: hypothetical protein DSZ06_04810 [Sulfurospirillum sp.]